MIEEGERHEVDATPDRTARPSAIPDVGPRPSSGRLIDARYAGAIDDERIEPIDQTLPLSVAPLLGARRDGSERADSTRARLVTLLGELVLPNGRAAWTQTLVMALGSLGVSEKAARQALARSEDRGWIERTRHGRRTRWELSDDMVGLLSAGAERIYGFGRSEHDWDGTWLVLLASIPDTDRGTRYRMTTELEWVGLGSIGHGVWISPWTEQEATVVDLVERLGIEARSFRAEMGRLGSPVELARQAWDLATLERRYVSFLDDTADAPTAAEGLGAVCELASVVHRWRRFPFLDPELPLELLPDGWPRRAAADRFAQLRQGLLGPAMVWWAEAEAKSAAD